MPNVLYYFISERISKKQKEAQKEKDKKKKEKETKKKKRQRDSKEKENIAKRVRLSEQVVTITQDEVHRKTIEFEQLNLQLKYGHCDGCKKTKLCLKTTIITLNYNRISLCDGCVKIYKNMGPNGIASVQKALPIWYDDNGQQMFHVPQELRCLREGEKLMIQLLSVYVPVHHLTKGQLGSKGHCAAFEQDVGSIAKILPKLPDQVKFIQVIRKYRDKKGEEGEKMFIIRKKETLNALRWLKRYNHHYRDVEIDEDRLNWINGEEAELPSINNRMIIENPPDSFDATDPKQKVTTVDDYEKRRVNDIVQEDFGPSKSQVYDVERNAPEIAYTNEGVVAQSFTSVPTAKFDDTINTLESIAKSTQQDVLFTTTEKISKTAKTS